MLSFCKEVETVGNVGGTVVLSGSLKIHIIFCDRFKENELEEVGFVDSTKSASEVEHCVK